MAATSLSFVLPLCSPFFYRSYTTYIHLCQDDPCAIVKSVLAMYLYFIAALLLATAISQDIQLSDVPSCGVSRQSLPTVRRRLMPRSKHASRMRQMGYPHVQPEFIAFAPIPIISIR